MHPLTQGTPTVAKLTPVPAGPTHPPDEHVGHGMVEAEVGVRHEVQRDGHLGREECGSTKQQLWVQGHADPCLLHRARGLDADGGLGVWDSTALGPAALHPPLLSLSHRPQGWPVWYDTPVGKGPL